MHASFIFWIIVSAIGCFSAYAIYDYSKRFNHKPWIVPCVKYMVATLAFIVVMSPLYYEFPNTGYSKIVTFTDDHQVEYKPWGTFCWEWSNNYFNLPDKPVGLKGTVTYVTENPKVRTITYHLDITVTSPRDFYRGERQMIHNNNNNKSGYDLNQRDYGRLFINDVMAKTVAPHLYNFNNGHSKELAAFFNPEDSTQNAELKTLIESSINPNLKKDGLQIVLRNFEIQ